MATVGEVVDGAGLVTLGVSGEEGDCGAGTTVPVAAECVWAGAAGADVLTSGALRAFFCLGGRAVLILEGLSLSSGIATGLETGDDSASFFCQKKCRFSTGFASVPDLTAASAEGDGAST